MTTLAFVVIAVVGAVIGVGVIRCAIGDQTQMAREVRADLAELEAAREAEAQDVAVITDLPQSPAPLLAGEILDDSHDPDWAPITPDLIA